MVLELNRISKAFGARLVLSDISFTVNEGQIMGFLGPNGAGKTTAIKIILGLLKADSGSVTINGFDLATHHDEALLRVGGIIESPDMYGYMSGYNNLMQYTGIYDVPESRVYEVLEQVRLTERANDLVKKYSLGMRQRLGLAQAILHKPNLLVLDEPTNGLDPAGIKELRDILHGVAESGCAVLVSSHQLAEMELMCDSLCIIEQGRIISSKTLDEFTAERDGEKLLYRFAVNDTDKAFELVHSVSENSYIREGFVFAALTKPEAAEVAKTIINAGIELYVMDYEHRSLETAFLEATANSFGQIS